MGLDFDNQRIDISSLGFEDFKKALSFFFRRPESTVKAFAISPTKGLILFWYHDHNSTKQTPSGGEVKPLPYEMNFEAALQFAWNWLQSPEANKCLGKEPDHDGDNNVGWRVYNEDWTHVDGRSDALVGIHPLWAMYGK